MQIHKALWTAAAFALVAAMMTPALACDKSGAKASTEIGKAGTTQVSAACAKTAGASSAQAGMTGCAKTSGASSAQAGMTDCASMCAQAGMTNCASMCGEGAVKQAQAVVCTRDTKECAQMLRSEYAKKGWLGAELQWNEGAPGPTVTAVVPGSPADEAGFRAGDVLTSMSGISFAPEQRAVLKEFKANAYKAGKTIRYTAQRGGEIVRLNPKLVKMPSGELDRMFAMHVTAHHPSEVASLEK